MRGFGVCVGSDTGQRVVFPRKVDFKCLAVQESCARDGWNQPWARSGCVEGQRLDTLTISLVVGCNSV